MTLIERPKCTDVPTKTLKHNAHSNLKCEKNAPRSHKEMNWNTLSVKLISNGALKEIIAVLNLMLD